MRAAATAAVRALFEDELPAQARTLAADHGQMTDAVGLYHLVLEGIVFAVGQDALLALSQAAGLRGLGEGVARVQADERWHVGLGVLHLQRLGELGPRLDLGLVTRRAADATAAWGPAIATPARVAHAMATHARRLRISGSDRVVDVELAR